MKKYIEALRKCSLFSNIESENFEKVLNCLGARVVEFEKKYTILAEGSEAKYIGIILSGSAQIIQVDYYGNRNIIGSLSVGDTFGESFAAAGIRRLPVSVVASDDSEVMLIECSRVLYTCERGCGFHQALIYNLVRSFATKNLLFHQRIEITSKRSTREKLMAYLMLIAKRTGKNGFEIPFDRQELADYLGVDRSGLSTEISKLRKEGIIESKKKYFKLL